MRPTRVQLKRTKGWRMPPGTVKVDRSTKWGNPYLIERQSGALWEQGVWRHSLYSVRFLGRPYWYRDYLTRSEAAVLACQRFASHIAPSMDLEAIRVFG